MSAGISRGRRSEPGSILPSSTPKREADAEALDAEVAANQAALEAAGHWGVPTLVFKGEPFFGQDRIDLALVADAAQAGLAPSQHLIIRPHRLRRLGEDQKWRSTSPRNSAFASAYSAISRAT